MTEFAGTLQNLAAFLAQRQAADEQAKASDAIASQVTAQTPIPNYSPMGDMSQMLNMAQQAQQLGLGGGGAAGQGGRR